MASDPPDAPPSALVTLGAVVLVLLLVGQLAARLVLARGAPSASDPGALTSVICTSRGRSTR